MKFMNDCRSPFVCLAALVLPAVLAGCMRTAPPEFHLNIVEMGARGVSAEQQQTVANILEAMFGTPDEAFVLAETGLDLKKLQLAAGPVRTGYEPSGRGLYRQHCAHCHGTTGDGQGPTASILNPYPRDYRQGKFKFKATERAAPPTNLDLERVIRYGVHGTAMPAFDLLPNNEVAALVEYVKYLSMRGQTEIALALAVSDLGVGEKMSVDRSVLVDEILTPVVTKWQNAEQSIVNPPERPEGELAASIARGRELFYGNVANCIKCHGLSALGDGQTSDYDDWNKPLFEMSNSIPKSRENIEADESLSSEERAVKLAALDDLEAGIEASLPIRTITPRNLRQGIYRGGRRPVDFYRRLYAGVNGTPMPGIGPTAPGGKGPVSPEDIWHLVDYLESLPYEAISKPPRQTVGGPQGHL